MANAVIAACFGLVPICEDAALAACVKASYDRHKMAHRLATQHGLSVVSLHHSGFDASDPFSFSLTIQLEDGNRADASVASFKWIRWPAKPLITYTSDLSCAIDTMEPDARTDLRKPHFKRSVAEAAVTECEALAADGSKTPRARKKAAIMARRIRTLISQSRRPRRFQPDLLEHRAVFVRQGVSSALGQPWEASATCSGRWQSAASGGDSFSWLKCSARCTVRFLRDYQVEVDISACFNAIDAMFAICSCETEEEAQGKYPWTLEYAAPDAASKHRAELARALGLPMTTEPQKTKAKKKVKPMLLKIGNGFGQNGETLVYKGLEYGMYKLPQGLVKELPLVRKAARKHPLIVPHVEELRARASARAESKVDSPRYAHLCWGNRAKRLEELLMGSFLAFCRQLVEAHIVAIMIQLFGNEGFRTACHVRMWRFS